MNNLVEIVAASTATVLGIVGVVDGIKFYLRRRRLQSIPRTVIAKLEEGMAEVHGRARAENYLISPISKTECIWYRYEVKEMSGGRRMNWHTIAEGSHSVPFFVHDETGTVAVDPTDASFEASPRFIFKDDVGILDGIGRSIDRIGDWGKSSDEKLAGMSMVNVKPHDPGWFEFWTSGDRRFTEYLIAANDVVCVSGAVVRSSESGQLIIKKGGWDSTLFIGDGTELALVSKLRKKALYRCGYGLLGLGIGCIGILRLLNVI